MHFIADINDDGFGDLVVSGEEGVWVAIGNGDRTFRDPRLVIKDFGYAGGWRIDKHPRFVVDLTGNGALNTIGFGDEAVWASYNDGKGSFGPVGKLTEEFSANCGWTMDKTVRWVANLE